MKEPPETVYISLLTPPKALPLETAEPSFVEENKGSVVLKKTLFSTSS